MSYISAQKDAEIRGEPRGGRTRSSDDAPKHSERAGLARSRSSSHLPRGLGR
jgi:hypothetical protein